MGSAGTSESTLYIHATIVTINPTRDIILDGALLVTSNRISAIGKTADLLSWTPSSGTRIVTLNHKILIPGLINIHAHLAQSLLRGLAEDLPLHSWLCDAIWPLEANYQDDDGYIAARLTIAEMLKSGTTCFLEAMCTYRSGFENVVRAVQETGIRASLGKLVKGPETNALTGMKDARDRDIDMMSIESALEAHSKHNGSCNDRLHVWMAAGTPRGSKISAHRAIGDACQSHGLGLTMHCAEAPKDLTIFRDHYNCSPAEFCQEANLIGNGRNTVLAHMVNLDLGKDLPILKQTGATVAHNPSSNCKLASGIAAIPEMLEAGVNVGLGTDGAPCANTYDMVQEMRLAGIIHKGRKRNASTVGAWDVLEMATIQGAKALGLDEEIGSLEVGKKADFVVINPSGLHSAPYDPLQLEEGGADPVTTVVYSCTGRDVDMVVVDGDILVENGQLVSLNEEEIKGKAREVVGRLRKASGISARCHPGWRYV